MIPSTHVGTPVKPINPLGGFGNYQPPRYYSPNSNQQIIDLLTRINANLTDIKELLKK